MPKKPANQHTAFSHDEEKQKGKMEVVKELDLKHYERYEQIASLPEEKFK